MGSSNRTFFSSTQLSPGEKTLKYTRLSAAKTSLKIPRISPSKSTTDPKLIFSGLDTSKAMSFFVQPPTHGIRAGKYETPSAEPLIAALEKYVPSCRYQECQKLSATHTSVPGLGQSAFSSLQPSTGTAELVFESSFTSGSADT